MSINTLTTFHAHASVPQTKLVKQATTGTPAHVIASQTTATVQSGTTTTKSQPLANASPKHALLAIHSTQTPVSAIVITKTIAQIWTTMM